jgi:hypothetical protein
MRLLVDSDIIAALHGQNPIARDVPQPLNEFAHPEFPDSGCLA